MVKVFSLEPGVWSVAYDVYQVLSGTNAWSPTGTGSSGLTVPASTTIVTANTTSTSSGTTGWWVLSVLAPAVITIAYGGASTIACGGNSFYITPYNPNLVPGNPLMSEIRLQKRRYHDDQKKMLWTGLLKRRKCPKLIHLFWLLCHPEVPGECLEYHLLRKVKI